MWRPDSQCGAKAVPNGLPGESGAIEAIEPEDHLIKAMRVEQCCQRFRREEIDMDGRGRTLASPKGILVTEPLEIWGTEKKHAARFESFPNHLQVGVDIPDVLEP